MSGLRGFGFLVCVILVAGCLGSDAELDAPALSKPGAAVVAGRTVLAEFVAHLDAEGGRFEFLGRGAGVPADALEDLVGEVRVAPPLDDADLTTTARSNSPGGGACVPDASWGYTVQLTNNGGDTWYTPAAQLTVIAPSGVTACNSDDTGFLLPDGGAAAADWAYGAQLAPTASGVAEWGFDPGVAASFAVRGVVTVGDPPPLTCGGKSAADSDVCGLHGACVAQDTCVCDPGYELNGWCCVPEGQGVDMCTVRFDFHGGGSEELSGQEGDEVYLLELRGEWSWCRNTLDQEGYMPTTYLDCR